MADEPIAAPLTPLLGKVRSLTTLQAALRAETQRAEVSEALVRTRLGDALARALAARARAEAETREAVFAHYRAKAPVRPARRNRPIRLAERALEKLTPLGQATILAQSGVWRGSDLGAMAAYARRGADPNARPAALFDQTWYLRANPDVAQADMSPLVHYLLRGGDEGRSPHPLFDGRAYQHNNAHALAQTGLTPLAHFVRIGAAEGRNPHPLFDLSWYVAQAPDLIGSGENPVDHYLRIGAERGLSPHRLFQPDYYRRQLPASEQSANPLVHYLTVGAFAGLKPHPLFDPAWYLDRYPDVEGGEPLSHFVVWGAEQLRSPGPWFDSEQYAISRGDQRSLAVDPLSDYLAGGAWSGAEPIRGFHPAAYLAAHPELADQGLTPLEHWARQPR